LIYDKADTVMKKLIALLATVCVLVFTLPGCGSPVATSSAETIKAPPSSVLPEASSLPAPATSVSEPELPTNLTANCPVSPAGTQGFNAVGLNTGQKAINFTLKDTGGREYRLSRLLAEKPVVMIFGSFT